MKITRKDFLRLGGVALLGAGIGKVAGAQFGDAAPANAGQKPVRWAW